MKQYIQLGNIDNVNNNLSCHHLIYKIYNNYNQKYYIGQHTTNNIYDGYSGSGKYLIREQKKYGLSNFYMDILFDFETFEEMNKMERTLVQLSNCYPIDKNSYNLKEGGTHGSLTQYSRDKISRNHIELSISLGKNNPMYGKDWRKIAGEEKTKQHNENVRKSLIGNTRMKDLKKNNPSIYEQWKKNISKNRKGKTAGKFHPMYGKNPLKNLTKEEMMQRSRKISEGNKRSWSMMSKEKIRQINIKRKITNDNKSEEQKKIEHCNRSKSVSGQRNGMYGKKQSEKNKRNLSKLNSGKNNPMYGKNIKDFMTEEEYLIWKEKVQCIWQNISEDRKKQILQKRRLSMLGKKWYHKKDNTVELLFGENDIIPPDFIIGRLKRKF